MTESPMGTTVRESIKRMKSEDPEFRREYERLGPFQDIAFSVIMRRGELGLTQEELAARMGTSKSAICRIESGQHTTTVRTLERLAAALDMQLQMGLVAQDKAAA